MRRGQLLEYFTILWNLAEGFSSVVAGVLAGSISLIGFGLDSFIEVTSGAALLWRLSRDSDAEQREKIERLTLRIIGGCFLALALYLTYDSVHSLVGKQAPQRSVLGIGIAALSLVVMPLLAREKRRVAAKIDSKAMNADARQTDFCTYLSAILLGGLLLNASASWWWTDSLAALVMVPIIAKEGIDAWQGKSCGACGCG